MSDVDWTAYQKCPACEAELGKPCFSLSGVVAEPHRIVGVQHDRPHGGRKLRAVSARG
jgi:hypothetical protein